MAARPFLALGLHSFILYSHASYTQHNTHLMVIMASTVAIGRLTRDIERCEEGAKIPGALGGMLLVRLVTCPLVIG